MEVSEAILQRLERIEKAVSQPRSRLMTIKDVQEYFGVSDRHAQRIVKQKTFPAPARQLKYTECGRSHTMKPRWFSDEIETWAKKRA